MLLGSAITAGLGQRRLSQVQHLLLYQLCDAPSIQLTRKAFTALLNGDIHPTAIDKEVIRNGQLNSKLYN